MLNSNNVTAKPQRRRYPRRGSVTEHSLRAQQTAIHALATCNTTPLDQAPAGSHRGNTPYGDSIGNVPFERGCDDLIVDFPTNRSLQPDNYYQAEGGDDSFTGFGDSHQIMPSGNNSSRMVVDPEQQPFGWNPHHNVSMRSEGRRDSTASSMAYSAYSTMSVDRGGDGAELYARGYHDASRRDSTSSTTASYFGH